MHRAFRRSLAFLLMIASIGRRGNIWRSIHGRGTGVAGCPQSAVHDRLWKRKSNRAGRIDRPAGTDRGQKEGFRMQYLAMLTMLIDHIGVVFFPDDPLWRIIGRIAFPIYAYGIVMGLAHTRSRKRYATRLAVIGAAAQLPYMAAMGVLQINVIGTFLAAIGVLALMERTPSPVLKAAVFLAGVA